MMKQLSLVPLRLTKKERKTLSTLLALLLLGLIGMLLLREKPPSPPTGTVTSFARPHFGHSAQSAG